MSAVRGGGEGTQAPVNGNRVIPRSQSEHVFHSPLTLDGVCPVPLSHSLLSTGSVQLFPWRGTIPTEPLPNSSLYSLHVL